METARAMTQNVPNLLQSNREISPVKPPRGYVLQKGVTINIVAPTVTLPSDQDSPARKTLGRRASTSSLTPTASPTPSPRSTLTLTPTASPRPSPRTSGPIHISPQPRLLQSFVSRSADQLPGLTSSPLTSLTSCFGFGTGTGHQRSSSPVPNTICGQGFEVRDLPLGFWPFDPNLPALRSQLLAALGAGPQSRFEAMTGFHGGMNNGRFRPCMPRLGHAAHGWFQSIQDTSRRDPSGRASLGSIEGSYQWTKCHARPLTKKSLKENQESKQREQELEVQLLRDLVERTGGKKPSTAEFLGRCFVLPALAEERTLATGKENRVVEELAHWGLKRFRLAVQKSLRERFSKCFDATGRLIWKEVFQGSSGAVKLELGAGSGEWVAAQATADRESSWVALELMRDRAHSILRRAIAKDLRNLYIFSGDALEMLRLLFPNTSVAHIFINFPEPPFVSGNEAAESSFHMMTSELFVQMHRVLQKGCDVTILSDNQRYMKSLADTAGSLVEQGLFRSVDLSTGKPLETLRGVTIYQGWPEKRSGHLVKSSSYFDSHWAKGQRLDRFYLLLRKVRKSGKDA